jgi:hypothetical protein
MWLYSLLSVCSFADTLDYWHYLCRCCISFHRVWVVCATTALVNLSNPLQHFSRAWHTKSIWYLLNLNTETAQKTLMEPPGCTKFPLRIQQLHLTQFSTKHRESWLGICSTYPQYLSLIVTETVSFSVLHKSPFKIAKRKTQLTTSTW